MPLDPRDQVYPNKPHYVPAHERIVDNTQSIIPQSNNSNNNQLSVSTTRVSNDKKLINNEKYSQIGIARFPVKRKEKDGFTQIREKEELNFFNSLKKGEINKDINQFGKSNEHLVEKSKKISQESNVLNHNQFTEPQDVTNQDMIYHGVYPSVPEHLTPHVFSVSPSAPPISNISEQDPRFLFSMSTSTLYTNVSLNNTSNSPTINGNIRNSNNHNKINTKKSLNERFYGGK